MSNSPCFTLVVKLVIPSSIYWTQENTGTCQLNSSQPCVLGYELHDPQIRSKYDRKTVQNMEPQNERTMPHHVSIPQRDNSRGCLKRFGSFWFSVRLRRASNTQRALAQSTELRCHRSLILSLGGSKLCVTALSKEA